ncbi:molybdopterin biosynthesis protein MoeZ [Microbacterium faecale]|uniref:Molybdopterin biosynthesis protein MoeZ n=1 Tax=Microbacterium faecale TaxID=1804630 RepID=A0A916YEV8_9MICO|nr:ThiF family adenylyltransferase [Microbacterium faecale]GGD40667.1 molybdopterin biosynthesis protein MoeZ [Microbacterium faecale]
MAFPPLVDPITALTEAEAARTARHAALYPFGGEGQRRLAAAHVAIVGAGGLGSPAVLALAAAGIGRITIIDDDVVEASNLQRQVLHRMSDLGSAKTASAVRAARDLAPECDVTEIRERVTPENAERLLSGADVVLDGTDTLATREAVASACERLGVPLVWGVVQEFQAQVTVFWSKPPAGVPPTRLGDLYPPGSAGELPTCAAVGVLGALVMHVGSIMSTQAILLIAGIGDPLVGRIALIDGLRSTTREVPLRARATGSAGDEPRAPHMMPEIDVGALTARLRSDAAPLVVDVRSQAERAEAAIGGSAWIPIDDILADPAAAADRLRAEAAGRDVVTVCAAGARSARATAALARAGVPSRSLSGGLSAWFSA